MPLSRSQRKTAAVISIVLLFLLSSTALAQPSQDLTITASGVGAAPLGLTAEELTAELGPGYDLGNEVRITVDFDGRVVTKDGEVQFRAAKTDPSDALNLFIVSNPAYVTAEGVGPTTRIADAEAIYGQATLSWNPDNEGREFVAFENGPDGRILFRTPGIGGTNVGIYADGEFETSDYEDNGAIAAVWVSCVSGTDCPADSAAGPTATPEPEPTATPEPEPTATPEPDATATPAPTATPELVSPEPTATPEPANGGGSNGGTDSELPQTGATELVLLSIVALFVLVGGALMLVERRYLCPAWLPRGRS